MTLTLTMAIAKLEPEPTLTLTIANLTSVFPLHCDIYARVEKTSTLTDRFNVKVNIHKTKFIRINIQII